MHRSLFAGLCLCVLAGALGCGEPEPRLITINEEGCVTASGDEFILTDLHPGERSEELEHLLPEAPRPTPTTEAYLLVGKDEELRPLAGQRVRVAGQVDAEQTAELRSISPMVRTRPAPSAETPAAPEGTTPRVATEHQIRMEIHRLQVTSISPTGDACGTMTTGS